MARSKTPFAKLLTVALLAGSVAAVGFSPAIAAEAGSEGATGATGTADSGAGGA